MRYNSVSDVRVFGAVGVVQCDVDWNTILAMRKSAIEEGVWLRPFGDVLYLAPPLTITEEELHECIRTIHTLLRRYS